MYPNILLLKALILLFSRFLFKHFKNSKSTQKILNCTPSQAPKFQRHGSLVQRNKQIINPSFIFSLEGALLKSPSLFPYFMLVAFEGGSIVRAFILLVLYPFIRFINYDSGLNIMVFISFFGMNKKRFMVGRAVLPKFLLENVALESFEVLRKGEKRVGVSDLPQVMIESFLKDYLDIEFVVGRELKVFGGYYLGILEVKKNNTLAFDEIAGNDHKSGNFVGITGMTKPLNHPLFSRCNEIYLVSEGERRKWEYMPRDKYPKPLIFHDGRLAFRPTPLATLSMFLWLPFGFSLAFLRALITLSLPFSLLTPLLAYTGLILNVNIINSNSNYILNKNNSAKGHLFVCNHRTLLDPLYFSFGLRKPVTAVTYSLSRISEILAPIRTVRLSRDRDQDSQTMKDMLDQGDVMICPEGTTCREPFLLRFSPLFSELSNEIVPVAMDSEVTMFYGTTASGFKCLDPLFFLMNPTPSYTMKILDKVDIGARISLCREKTRYDLANYVQSEIGKALDFECTRLTRKDKYLILAGNEGVVSG